MSDSTSATTTAPSLDALDVLRASIAFSLPTTLLDSSLNPIDSLKTCAFIQFPPAAAPAGGASEPVRLNRDAPTRYTAKASTDSTGKTDFYTLAQLYLAWIERETGVVEYLKKATEAGIGNVGIADRRGVLEYLSAAEGAEERAGGRVRAKGETCTWLLATLQGIVGVVSGIGDLESDTGGVVIQPDGHVKSMG